MNVDLFCKTAGVERQKSEARNQASNGKAERMHRTVLNMARSMVFASRLPLSFWGDAVKYAAFVLNRSTTSANARRASPLQMLTKQTPDLREIVAFGSICTVDRDPRKNSLKQLAQVGAIVGRSDETKGYRVFLKKDNVVVVTQHVKTLKRSVTSRTTGCSAYSMTQKRTNVRLCKPTKAATKKKSQWTRTAHGTRSA